ncbi:MAG TPA: ATP-binding protein [Terriglobia bacterium]|nr:ATP-binding protein [Terriglobia bacterium]
MTRKPPDSVMVEEQKVASAQRLVDAVLNISLSCMAILDRHYNFIRVNEAYARAARKHTSEFTGRNHFDLCPNFPRSVFDQVVRTKHPSVSSARPFLFSGQPDHGVTYWDWRLAPVLDSQGEVECLISSLNDVTARTRAAEEIQQHSRLVLEARENERRRIARELHDSIAQQLGAVLALLAAVRESHQLGSGPAENLKTAMVATEQSLQEIRNISHLLHPPALSQWGLRRSLVWFVAQYRRATGITVDLKLPSELHGLSKDVQEAIFRIVQEALNNVARHAQSSRAKLEMLSDASRVTLRITDRGKGIAPTTLERYKKAYVTAGIGLSGIRERVAQLGGKCEIASSPRGTALCVTLPRPRHSSPAGYG